MVEQGNSAAAMDLFEIVISEWGNKSADSRCRAPRRRSATTFQ